MTMTRPTIACLCCVAAMALPGCDKSSESGAQPTAQPASKAEKLSVEERIATEKELLILPAADQSTKWRKLAADPTTDVTLRGEALTQLALLDDGEGVALALEGLEDGSHKVRAACAQVLAHYGLPRASGAKPALLKAVKEADESDRRQLVWALVALEEPTIFKQAFELYKSGELTTVERLRGGKAFDPVRLAALVSPDEMAKHASDPSAAVRQLVATTLSASAQPKHTDVLVKLVKDPDIAVAREAASGLGRIGDDSARKPLLEALRAADKESRLKFLHALRDGVGGVGLVLALDTVSAEPEERNWFQTQQLFAMLEKLADPRIGDGLVEWVERTGPLPHWKTQAGLRLAEVGDIRGAEYIAQRMPLEAHELYERSKFWQADTRGHLSRGDRAPSVGARMLADLAVIHPDRHQQLIDVAAEDTWKWLSSGPAPEANGLRFMAAVGWEKAREPMRKWAFPTEPLPLEGAQPPFPMVFATAQSALRYLGWMKDEPSLPKLIEQLARKKDDKLDITQQGLVGAGLAMRAMALRAVALGASEGLAQWGPEAGPRAEKQLMKLIEDVTWHEEARQAACAALAWVGTDDTMSKVAKKVGEFAAKEDRKSQFIGACYAQTLGMRANPKALGALVGLLRPQLDAAVRISVAQAIGVTGIPAGSEHETKLFAMLGDEDLRVPAALALLLGGTDVTAARALATFGGTNAKALRALEDHYYRAFGYFSDRDLEAGNLFRWVRNAQAVSRVRFRDAPQSWARHRLQAQLDNLEYDNGPHSVTRVVLRHRLRQLARSGKPEQQRDAIMTLVFMREQGTLMALRDEAGLTGTLARQAVFELLNPQPFAKDDLSHLED